MAYSDPLSITISGITTSLPRVSTGDGNSKYQSGDGLIDVIASSSYGNRTRRVFRVDHSKITADPFIPAQNRKVSCSVYTVFDVPNVGYTASEVAAIWAGKNTLETANTSLLITKLLGGES